MPCCSPGSTATAARPAPAEAIPAIAAPKVHLHVLSTDLATAVAFYRAFLGAEPVKLRSDYAKFLPDWAPLNLAISEQRSAGGGSVSHVGIQLPSPWPCGSNLARVEAAGVQVRVEMGETCCYANQDKFWVIDPAGLEWEVYAINFDVAGPARDATTACCPG